MAHLITPIVVAGETKCCVPAFQRTDAVLEDDATAVDETSPSGYYTWELFLAQCPDGGDLVANPFQQTDRVYEGTVTFGVCCASEVVLELWGNIETYVIDADPYDWIEVKLNGTRVLDADGYQQAIADGAADPSLTEARPSGGVYTVTIPIVDAPCGNVIEIKASTGDVIANNGVWWRAKVASIS